MGVPTEIPEAPPAPGLSRAEAARIWREAWAETARSPVGLMMQARGYRFTATGLKPPPWWRRVLGW